MIKIILNCTLQISNVRGYKVLSNLNIVEIVFDIVTIFTIYLEKMFDRINTLNDSNVVVFDSLTAIGMHPPNTTMNSPYSTLSERDKNLFLKHK